MSTLTPSLANTTAASSPMPASPRPSNEGDQAQIASKDAQDAQDDQEEADEDKQVVEKMIEEAQDDPQGVWFVWFKIAYCDAPLSCLLL
ncbi:hypothetical protein L198_02579 [Cryptococcus wingfieldii CBS 7118]|uniref:Uncharacterized protein n=1 Tax=Cryptococcus wingfieldii CBS 7118 TaxID=1295528 RepID=A0A1E3JPL0_9TREE|nr:hypothetical protein L198_02579 [Cryptococcus wingfieldii CBS 7118]ODO01852.1 hypothetical protein L198_02579 [Cryptococcus wingfieldii CBS 7118]